MLIIFLAAVAVGLIIYLVKVIQRLNSFTQADEVRFWSLFVKKQPSKKALNKIKKTILFTYANNSQRNKISYWIERCIIDIGFIGGTLWAFVVIGFNMNFKLLLPSLICFMLVIPNIWLLSNQLYLFWKDQTIWRERPLEEQSFLLPNAKDHKLFNKYWLQLFLTLYALLIIGIYCTF